MLEDAKMLYMTISLMFKINNSNNNKFKKINLNDFLYKIYINKLNLNDLII